VWDVVVRRELRPVLDERELADFMAALRKLVRGKGKQAVTAGGKRTV
jgi:hypothetical protein